ncbi:MAG: biotin/lipoyl-binding protein [Cyclobacteriaceae bacterium]|nr:biotin/lipoyl-binding protein [Cyclobacteriaceae bacterium]
MYKATVGARTMEINLEKEKVTLNGKEVDFQSVETAPDHFHILSANKSFRAEVVSVNKEKKEVQVKINNSIYNVILKDKMDELLEQLGMDALMEVKTEDLKAPMPGLILEIAVEKGQSVTKGDKLAILEAMKMENVIKASGDGVVNEIKVKVGESVENGQTMITFE